MTNDPRSISAHRLFGYLAHQTSEVIDKLEKQPPGTIRDELLAQNRALFFGLVSQMGMAMLDEALDDLAENGIVPRKAAEPAENRS